MNKLSLPPQRSKPTSEAEIEAIINKGGSPAPKQDVNPETIRHVNTRLTEGLIRQIDALRASRPRKMGSPKMGISLRDWIVEAVVEKLERETAAK
ncbi:hypothetical protein [Fibrella forsythiae]|uniref:Uncharacterized protein n=1 Tax=Fibrella forsythiae TaxID=2817061 RepID=A0ABS3JVB9_9BACT|nr:hypothetical protein [Fibrella forsythiae]MBO0952862.1 hypothetical protein [Fibrella forsythiae]